MFPLTVLATAVVDEREQEWFLFVFVVVVVVVVVVVLRVEICSALPAQCRIQSFETQRTSG